MKTAWSKSVLFLFLFILNYSYGDLRHPPVEGDPNPDSLSAEVSSDNNLSVEKEPIGSAAGETQEVENEVAAVAKVAEDKKAEKLKADTAKLTDLEAKFKKVNAFNIKDVEAFKKEVESFANSSSFDGTSNEATKLTALKTGIDKINQPIPTPYKPEQVAKLAADATKVDPKGKVTSDSVDNLKIADKAVKDRLQELKTSRSVGLGNMALFAEKVALQEAQAKINEKKVHNAATVLTYAEGFTTLAKASAPKYFEPVVAKAGAALEATAKKGFNEEKAKSRDSVAEKSPSEKPEGFSYPGARETRKVEDGSTVTNDGKNLVFRNKNGNIIGTSKLASSDSLDKIGRYYFNDASGNRWMYDTWNGDRKDTLVNLGKSSTTQVSTATSASTPSTPGNSINGNTFTVNGVDYRRVKDAEGNPFVIGEAGTGNMVSYYQNPNDPSKGFRVVTKPDESSKVQTYVGNPYATATINDVGSVNKIGTFAVTAAPAATTVVTPISSNTSTPTTVNRVPSSASVAFVPLRVPPANRVSIKKIGYLNTKP